MEKAWNVRRLDVRGELSLRGSDCKMNPEFDFCVIQAFVIRCLVVWGCLCVCILVRVYYRCGFVWIYESTYKGVCARVCVLASNLDLCCWCLPAFFFFALGLNPSGEPCSVLFQSRYSTLPPLPALPPSLPPAILSSNNMLKSNTWSAIIWNIFVKPPSRTAAVNVSASLSKIFHT